MAKQTLSNIKLGVFVVSGLLLLVLILYMIGKNHSLFSSNFEVKVRFRNAEGLTKGNNIRFAGIQSGTVKKIDIINDTTIEVVMLIDEDIKGNIRKNSICYIGSEGLMGNKVVNIVPNVKPADQVDEGDILLSRAQADISEALGTLYQTNDNVSELSEELLHTVRTINNSRLIRTLLEDTLLLPDLHSSLVDIRNSSSHLNNSTFMIEGTVKDMRAGRGVLGVLVANEEAEQKTKEMLNDLNEAGRDVNNLMDRVDSIATILEVSVNDREGLVYALLRDTAFAGKLARSLNNVEQGTAAFNEDMEALKHNFLLRGYFRKQEKRRSKNR
jgi:phospholipid/cholesterol/gamma-HCH transport system substrate-binding protein